MSRADRPPFQTFLDEHGGPVMAFLRAMVGPVDADDCFQETFLAALRAYPRARGGNLRSWVLTIARNKAIDHHRGTARRAEPVADPDLGAADAEPNGFGGELWGRVAELPDGQRAAVALRFAGELPYREIGEALECSEAAARRRVHDGLTALRAAVTTEKEDR